LCGVSLIVIYFVTKYKSEQENIEKEWFCEQRK
jgi:hypothetical protein